MLSCVVLCAVLRQVMLAMLCLLSRGMLVLPPLLSSMLRRAMLCRGMPCFAMLCLRDFKRCAATFTAAPMALHGCECITRQVHIG